MCVHAKLGKMCADSELLEMMPCLISRCPSMLFVRTRQCWVPPLPELSPATGPYHIEQCWLNTVSDKIRRATRSVMSKGNGYSRRNGIQERIFPLVSKLRVEVAVYGTSGCRRMGEPWTCTYVGEIPFHGEVVRHGCPPASIRLRAMEWLPCECVPKPSVLARGETPWTMRFKTRHRLSGHLFPLIPELRSRGWHGAG